MDKEQIKKVAEEFAELGLRDLIAEVEKPWDISITDALLSIPIRGAERRINSVWHDAETAPKENSKIVLIDMYGDWHCISYNFDEYDDCFGKGWDSCVRTYNIDKWAYLEGLLPERKETAE